MYIIPSSYSFIFEEHWTHLALLVYMICFAPWVARETRGPRASGCLSLVK